MIERELRRDRTLPTFITLLVLVLCYPIAYYLAQVARGRKVVLLTLGLVIPFWINELLRTLAWVIVLARNGIINSILVWLGLTEEPLRMMGTDGGVIAGMVYAYILFMVFPLYNEEIHLLGRRGITDFDDLTDRRVAIGREGSGTYLTARLLFKVSEVTPK